MFSISIAPMMGNENFLGTNGLKEIDNKISSNISQKNLVQAAKTTISNSQKKSYKKSSYWSRLFKSVGPKSVKVTKDNVRSIGRCSCGKKGSYNYYSAGYKNYCPYCKKTKALGYEQGKTCPEGMWVCKRCDADFCLVTGREHLVSKKAKFLKKETKKKTKKQVKSAKKSTKKTKKTKKKTKTTKKTKTIKK
jgi:hypothetical protein